LRRPPLAEAENLSVNSVLGHSRAVDPTKVSDGQFPVVGIGMSAGGLEVATAFLKAMPADSGMAFIFVQHLDPTRESLLADLLARETAMPVVRIEDGMRIEPDHVYVIIPAKTLLIKDSILRLVEPEEPRGQRHPIDRFFSALAEDQQEKAIAIVLSGAGSNGTAGLQDIKQAGGLCIAQTPITAKFDSMPRHAIASEVVDYILPPEEMPEALLRYARHSYVHGSRPEKIVETGGADLNDVLDLLREKTGLDFRQYKRATLSRRVHRRMNLAHVERLADYLRVLIEKPDEAVALGKDLMINVTAFFRDKEAWDALDRDVITPLVENAGADQTIRIWVPACSTGEEAYTIAMLLAERGAASNKALSFKIFATDAADHHLSAARKATFPGSMVESLSAERLVRFFDKADDNYYRIKPEIRETVLFAPQNLLRDPPYSRIDVVSCRNLLIYLEPEAQDKVLSLAHFALREGGFLFLGNAETVGRRGHLFETVSKRWRIYRRVGPPRSSALKFSDWPMRDRTAGAPTTVPTRLADIALKSLAEQFAPVSVLIDRSFRVLHFHGSTEEYLTQPAGAPTLDLLSLARDGLRLTIRSAVRKAIEDKKPVTVRANFKGGAKNAASVLVTANPVRDAGNSNGMILVSFVGDKSVAAGRSRVPTTAIEPTLDHDLEGELRAAREEMRSTVEQFETANEELTAANEEVTSVNEELQSTNEELEASKEELQALNEELSTINAQLDRKVIELANVGDDLTNLLMGNNIATIFLDTEMRIKWFTPAIQPLFELIQKDVGRPISSFSQKFAGGALLEKAQAAVARLTTFEEEIQADNGRYYLLRVLPYRTGDNRIAGAVATFIDVNDLKTTQAETAAARDFAEAIVETVRDPLLALTGDLRVRSANTAFYRMFGSSQAEIAGQLVYNLGNGHWDNPQLRTLLEEMLPERQQIDDFEFELTVPQLGGRCMLLNARRIDGDDGRAELILLALEDITERKNAILHQDILVSELSHRVKNTLAIVQSIAAQTMRHSGSLDAFKEAFEGRLLALADANDAVIDGRWKGVRLKHVVQRSLRPFAAETQITLGDGRDIDLRPQASLALAMILHELATNAVKYGALSVPTGVVAIAWRIEGEKEQCVTLDWTESRGPAVAPPARKGQGMRFIERGMSYELKGQSSVAFEPDGLRVSLTFPISSSIMPAVVKSELSDAPN
jgi:two-component system CheB/CheR fusion protein